MEELIQKENIAVNIEVKNWEEAIKSVGNLLETRRVFTKLSIRCRRYFHNE